MLFILLGVSLLTVPAVSWFHGRPSPGNMTQGYPWPLPKVYTITSERPRYIDPASFTFTAETPGCDILDQALVRYKKITFPKYQRPDVDPLPEMKGVHVYISDGCPTEVPQFGIDESYKLTTAPQSPKAYISAKTVWGALRGIDTFSQMFYKDAQDKVRL
uniref:Glycohydro_20b2 domain-containing protein n=1 Tax=Panagrellus redivivus TaxID=6233 RepID=A0A7E4VLH6_PANRE